MPKESPYPFWSSWTNLSDLENSAINTLTCVEKDILARIPHSKIYSIYVKGSFIRREMNQYSDVDMTVIVKTNNDIKLIKGLAKQYKGAYNPEINLGSLSLWELENNKRFYETKKRKARPYLFLSKVKNYELIYGKAISAKDYPKPEYKKYLKGRIKTFHNLFIPWYEKKEINFSGLIKQVFWLVELEQINNKISPGKTWKELNNSIKDPNHIMHLAYEHRIKNTRDKKLRNEFIDKLKLYLNNLEVVA